MKHPLPNALARLCRCIVPAALLLLGLTQPAWAALTVNAGNGTVTDSSTGLVWDQCPYGLSGATCAAGTALLGSWQSALAAAVAANAANYKGFNDWRVPNVNELESITKLDTYSAGQPAIDTSAFPNTPTGGDSWDGGGTWTSTSYAPGPYAAWIVLFHLGDSGNAGKTNSNYLRLVRGGQSLASSDVFLATQTITFANPGAQTFGTTPTLSATASSGLAVSFTTTTTGVCTITSGGALTFVGVGTCTITAAQAGDANFNPAQLSRSFAVNGLSQTITGFSPASPVVFGAAPATLSASGGASGSAIVYATTSANTICTVSGSTVSFTGVGTCNLTANQAAAGNYSAAPQATASITINASRSVSGTSPASGTITAAFSGGNGSCSYATTAFTNPGAPPGVRFSQGVFSFTTTDCGAGATLNFTITYPQTLPAGTRYYKFGPEFGGSSTPHWYVLPGAVVNGNQITFSITDNAQGDSNPAAGFITDPGGPGVPLDSGVAGVPTLSQWGLIILTFLLGLMALPAVRQRR